MKPLNKGSKIVARDCDDKALIRLLWDIGEQCVYVCSSEQFKNLLNGDLSAPAIGFPIDDVYEYDESIEAKINSNLFDWNSLNSLERS